MGSSNTKSIPDVRLDGKLAIVTGSNRGIGKMTALDFYKRGAHVIMACRNRDKANSAMDDIKQKCKNIAAVGQIECVHLNLACLDTVRTCARNILEKHLKIDLLINNAGIICNYARTEDEFEIQFGTNYLGPFLFTLFLMPAILKAESARIVNVSSRAHQLGHLDFNDLNWEERKYNFAQAHNDSKLAVVLFTKELAIRLEEAGIEHVSTYCVYPGMVATGIGREMRERYDPCMRCIWNSITLPCMRMCMKSPAEGARTTIYCAVDENVGKETGLYYFDCEAVESGEQAKNTEDAEKLWEMSLKMVGFEHYDLKKFKK